MMLMVRRVERIDADTVVIVWREGRSLFDKRGTPVGREQYEAMRPLRPTLPPWEQITSVQPLDAA